MNKYQYAYNNPLRYVDPDGHEPDCCDQETEKRVATGAAAGAAVGAVVGGVVGAGRGATAGGALGVVGGVLQGLFSVSWRAVELAQRQELYREQLLVR